jgi:hypothetical protein
MSKFKIQGTITKIGEKKEVANGAVVIDYVVDETAENGYITRYSVGMYKKAEYAEHVDNFLKFNKVGDNVELEFTVRSREYEGRIYNELNHWRCDKVGVPTENAGELDPLPF